MCVLVSAIIPDREADEGSTFAAPSKRIRQRSTVDSESESGAGASAGEPDVSDYSNKGADCFGRHVEEIPAGTRADGTATRARKRVVYK